MTVAILLMVMPLSSARAVDKGPAGDWQGTLHVGTALRIVVHITKTGSGSLRATLDSPDQGAAGIPVQTVTLSKGDLVLELPNINGRYEGNLDGDRITGKFTQNGVSVPLILIRTLAPLKVRRPQEPRKPYPYRVEQVSYPGGAESVRMAGTLTIPEGTGPFPCAILIAGSGPNTRDEPI
ncbi:MAG TPA: hypothetical protein VGS41_16070, partial [Chthonomonadales bacterium]|nr:hypothetical protein [Chthonomonadales bacterium]